MPWEVEANLTAERLTILARVLFEIRRDARAEMKGDGVWSLGCVVHERTCDTLTALAESGVHPWLSVNRDRLRCVVLIDGVPIRFCSGVPERPRDRQLTAAFYAAQEQLYLDFGPDARLDDDSWFWLIMVRTDSMGRGVDVVVEQGRKSGEVRNAWAVPLDAPAESGSGTPGTVVPMGKEGVEIEPPVIVPRTGPQVQRTGGDDNGND